MARMLKDSGIEILERIPSEWNTCRTKDIFRQAVGKPNRVATKYVGLEHVSGWTGIATAIDLKDATVESAQHIQAGTICFSKLRPYLAKAFVAQTDLLCTGELLGMRALLTVVPRYALYWLLSHRFITAINDAVAGTKMPRVDWATLSEMPFPLPSIREQRRIAAWLDIQTGRIDKRLVLLGKKRELLGNLRISVISEAVCLGIDSQAAMRDSGNTDIGVVPKHWQVIRLKDLALKIGSGKTPLGGGSVYSEAGITFLRSQNVWDDGLRLDDVVFISEEIDRDMKASRVKSKDILLNITGASIGRTALVPEAFPRANVSQHVCIVRLRDTGLANYVVLALLARSTQRQIAVEQVGAARDGLNFEQIGRLVTPFSLNADERQKIVELVMAKVSKINQQIRLLDLLEQLIKQQRKAIIHDAVTGKIDLFAYAPPQPQEAVAA